MSITEGVTVQMTAEEHYALTALLRSAVTIGGIQRIGLSNLLERLGQPYRDELVERGRDTLQELPALRDIEGHPIHIEVPIEHQHEGVYSSTKPLEWYRWHTDPRITGDSA